MLSYWEKIMLPNRVDVLIAGAGFAGLWTALHLKQQYPTLSVLIVEKENIPTGASTRNAGFACYGSASELLADMALLGEEAMHEIFSMRYHGIAFLRETLGDTDIDFEYSGGYELLVTQEEANNILDKLAYLNNLLASTTHTSQTFYSKEHQYLKNYAHLLFTPLEGSLHSGKLWQALHKKLIQLGVQFQFNNGITHWQNIESGVAVQTAQQQNLHCNQLVFCTNAYTGQLLPATKVIPARGQVLVTQPLPDITLNGSFHCQEGYYYFRHLPNNQILIGGARHLDKATEQTLETALNPLLQNHLLSFLQKHIKTKHSIEINMQWSGIMGFTEDKLPQMFCIDNAITALVACNGMGVALLPVFTKKILNRF
jgi:gamma-glutamylputrescine oxidase